VKFWLRRTKMVVKLKQRKWRDVPDYAQLETKIFRKKEMFTY
jgi:hypothetical protein